MAITLGFIGLGVMGEAMCRNLAKKSGAAVVAHDTRPGPLEALGRDGVTAAPSTATWSRARRSSSASPASRRCGRCAWVRAGSPRWFGRARRWWT